MASLTGQSIANTYDSLLKLTDNEPLTSSLKTVTDGLGNSSLLQLSTVLVNLTGALTATSATLSGALSVNNNDISQDGTRPVFSLKQSGTSKLTQGISSSASDLSSGSVTGDVIFRTSSQSFLWTVDGGTTSVFRLTSSGLASFTGNGAFGTISGNLEVGYGSTQGLYKLDINGSARFASSIIATSATLSGALLVNNNDITQDGTRPIFSLKQSGTTKVFLGISTGSNDLVNGDSAGDAVFRKPSSSGAFRFTVDGGSTSSLIISTSGITTSAPSGGTAKPFKVGAAASVSPTSPNRTIEIEIDGTTYYLSAKTTND